MYCFREIITKNTGQVIIYSASRSIECCYKTPTSSLQNQNRMKQVHFLNIEQLDPVSDTVLYYSFFPSVLLASLSIIFLYVDRCRPKNGMKITTMLWLQPTFPGTTINRISPKMANNAILLS